MILTKDDLYILEQDLESKIISKFTVLIPFLNLNIDGYVSTEEKLPPIDDAILRLYEGTLKKFNKEKVSKLLGIDEDSVENSFIHLLEKEYIDFNTRSLTDEGRKYIVNRKVINRSKQKFNLIINRITGEVSYQEEGAFIRFKDKQKSYFDTLYDRNNELNMEEIISLQQVKKVWDYRKNIDDYHYKGELLEVLNFEEKGSVFKKFNIYYFMNKQNNVEIRAYDRNTRDKELEKFILERESIEHILTQEKYDFFFEKNVASNIDNIVKDYKNIPNETEMFESFNFLEQVKEKVDIFFPLTKFLHLDDDLIYFITKLCKSNKTVNVYFSGIDPVNIRQRYNINKLVKQSKKSKYLNVFSIKQYCPQSFVMDNDYGKIFMPNIIPINISGISSKCVLFSFKELREDQLKYINDTIIPTAKSNMEIPNTFDLKKTSKAVFSLIEEVDSLFEKIGFGWLANSNETELKEFLYNAILTKKENEFQAFTTKFSTKIVENFKKTTTKKRGKNYFDKDFKMEWSQLSKAMNRIRVYRNSYSHDNFNRFIQEMSYEIIPDDFCDYCPLGISNSFEYKQYKMLEELLVALTETKKQLENTTKSPF